MTKRALAVLLGCFLASAAHAKDLYVNASTGDDSVSYADNGESRPWRTLGRAVWGNASRTSPNSSQAARAGDVVLVTGNQRYPGPLVDRNYEPAWNPVNSGQPGAPITIRAVGTVRLSDSTTGDATRGQPLIGAYTRDYIVWDGFYIDEVEANTKRDTGPVVMNSTTGSQIINSTIIGYTQDGWGDNHNGVRIENATSCVVRNNTISHFYASGGNANGSTITSYGSTDILIEHNDLSDTQHGFYGKATDSSPIRGMIIRYNLIRNTEKGLELQAFDGGGNRTQVYQNVIDGCTINGISFILPFSTLPRAVDFVNNTIHDCQWGFRIPSLDEDGHVHDVRFFNNIVAHGQRNLSFEDYTAYSAEAALNTPSRIRLQHNLYFGATAEMAKIDETRAPSFSDYLARLTNQERETGAGRASAYTDPRFVDRNNGDFTLCTGAGTPAATCPGASPALGMGVDVLDLDRDGSTTDAVPAGAYVTGNEIIGLTSEPAGGGSTTGPAVVTGLVRTDVRAAR